MKINETVRIQKLPDDAKFWIDSLSGGGDPFPEAQRKAAKDNVLAEFTTVVGEVGMHIARSNYPILAVRWKIGGLQHTAADYVISTTVGMRMALTEKDLVTNPVTFCWWRGGVYVVTCTITTTAGTAEVSHSFEVTAPLVRDFNAGTGVVGVGTYMGSSYIRLARSLHEFDRDGILMNAVVAGTQSVRGVLAGIQLASNQRFSTTTDGKSYRLDTNGTYILDIGMTNTIFYQDHFQPIGSDGENVNYDASDGPGAQLNDMVIHAMLIGDGDETPTVPETYRMFLMFLADVPGAIWVPLKVLEWSWEGVTTFKDGAWTAAQDAGVAVSDPADPAGFPQWNQNTSQSRWVPF
jgi:hypothetical protein